MYLKNIPLLFAMIRNIRAERVNRSMIGHTISRRIGPVTHDDIYSYVEATLDNPVRYRDENCAVPPFLPLPAVIPDVQILSFEQGTRP